MPTLETVYTSIYKSPLGDITIASNGVAITGLWFHGQKNYGSTLNTKILKDDHSPIMVETRLWLDTYFGGKDPGFTPHISLAGTIFRKRVWRELLDIPFGHTITYGEIAQKLITQTFKTSMLARAVGNAVANNPISLIVPCHRVVGHNGNLTGYAGGIHIKAALLRLEQSYIKTTKPSI